MGDRLRLGVGGREAAHLDDCTTIIEHLLRWTASIV